MTKKASTTKELQKLRLPELQVRYGEVVGETTRCPNRKYLIRRITEALASEPASTKPAKRATDTGKAASTKPRKPTSKAANAKSRKPTAKSTGKTTTKPAKPDAGHPTAEQAADGGHPTAKPAEPAPEQLAGADEPTADTPLKDLTIDQLRERYVETVGRPTDSTHRRYLMWKIRQAERGLVPVGPRPPRSTAAPADMKILPLRMEAAHVEQLDAARQRLGLKNRMHLFREALAHYLTHRNDPETAALFSGSH